MINEKTILHALPHVLSSIDLFNLGTKYHGKVRDFYIYGDTRVTVTTDRQSAFDVILGNIPFKGSVLNMLSAFWFEKTKHIVPNHMISVPHPNALISHNCQPIPVEMVIRGYISGVTKTSIWYSYERGERVIYGIKFPEGLKKNQKLPHPVITPTTHPLAGSSVHDERLTREQIIEKKIVPQKLYEQMEKTALQLFELGTQWCQKHGLILVDTKYEFGLYNGKLMLIDEIHTPDSSRFWIAKTYKERIEKGLEPENFDKEFLRLWYAKRGYRGDGTPPPMPNDLIVALAKRYIGVYEKITGETFKGYPYPIEEGIKASVTVTPTLSYKDVGDDYETKDPLKTIAQRFAARTKQNIRDTGIKEVTASRGESAYVFDMGKQYGACTQEGLGTKNLIADAMHNTKETYYDAIGIDTVATIVNDLITVGARPLVVSPHWAVGDNAWLQHTKRFRDLVSGWVRGCTQAGAAYGGGETPTLKGIVAAQTIELSGSAFGIIFPKKNLITEDNIHAGDTIILFESSGIHTNGLSLARSIAQKLPDGYATKLKSGKTLGEALLTPSIIYAKLVRELQNAHIHLHYFVHITGHGWRKLMRAKKPFTYRLTMVPPVPEEFILLQEKGPIAIEEMYGTFNMGAGFACFVSPKDVATVQATAKRVHIKSFVAGTVEKGHRQVIIEPIHIVYKGDSLQLK